MRVVWVALLVFSLISPAMAELKWHDYRSSTNVEDRRLAGSLSNYNRMFVKWEDTCEGLGGSADRLVRIVERAILKTPALAKTDVYSIRLDLSLLKDSCHRRLREAYTQFKKIERLHSAAGTSSAAYMAGPALNAGDSQREAARQFAQHEQNLVFQEAALREFEEIITRRKAPKPSAVRELEARWDTLREKEKVVSSINHPEAAQELHTFKMRLKELNQEKVFLSSAESGKKPRGADDVPFKRISDYYFVLLEFGSTIHEDMKNIRATMEKVRGMKSTTLKNEKGLNDLESLGSPLP